MAEPTIIDYALANWRNLNEVIDTMTLDELAEAKRQEHQGKERKSFVLRLANKIISVQRRRVNLDLRKIRPKPRRG